MSDSVKLIHLFKRRSGVSRDELAMHLFTNPMPGGIANMDSAHRQAKKYVASVFSGSDPGTPDWDGLTTSWWDRPLPEFDADPSSDSFGQKAELFPPWETKEFVILDGKLPGEPLTPGDSFPRTRSGFTKLTLMLQAKPGVDFDQLFTRWVEHADNIHKSIQDFGCFRYVLSHSLKPETEEFAGLGEVYFDHDHGRESVEEFRNSGTVEPDGFGEEFVGALHMYVSDTEVIGTP